ncbi:predicted protein [Sclerotinia sclerotiorum 1980 UF-70]|uniref:Uncharacterized protein n=1 Tax=Sclerotinia sclerotiorum (strain ATCC 18683 / 1980 / Ss-1) TaxID=665079 RepID=A7EM82_SCLS1|nr:predicted protein [Sclerotinia sclerotiorum 1980 UF-70]EDO03948.1 predicted protein [Sclerotinia sclerotiorum 1980 UF-70]
MSKRKGAAKLLTLTRPRVRLTKETHSTYRTSNSKVKPHRNWNGVATLSAKECELVCQKPVHSPPERGSFAEGSSATEVG